MSLVRAIFPRTKVIVHSIRGNFAVFPLWSQRPKNYGLQSKSQKLLRNFAEPAIEAYIRILRLTQTALKLSKVCILQITENFNLMTLS